jgi:hypothetical protein
MSKARSLHCGLPGWEFVVSFSVVDDPRAVRLRGITFGELQSSPRDCGAAQSGQLARMLRGNCCKVSEPDATL